MGWAGSLPLQPFYRLPHSVGRGPEWAALEVGEHGCAAGCRLNLGARGLARSAQQPLPYGDSESTGNLLLPAQQESKDVAGGSIDLDTK